MTLRKSYPNPETTLRRLLTVKQVAEALQTSTRTVQRFISNGELEAIRIGRLVRIRPAAFEAFIGKVTRGYQAGELDDI